MLLDAFQREDGQDISTDICIVGAGAAGITIALKLAEAGVAVVLLESGGLNEENDTQALYQGQVVDEKLHSPVDKYRQRRFGGSTTIWGGRCMPFDPIDFEKRDYIAESGWPINYQDVAQYYPEASKLCEIGEPNFKINNAQENAPNIIKGFSSDIISTQSIEKFSCPTNFAQRYGHRLESNANVTVILHSNCTAIELTEDGKSVSYLQVKTLKNTSFKVSAKKFIIAMGGLETPRLLLASCSVNKAGVGNEHDVVGRYYMCHMAGNIGEVKLNGSVHEVYHNYFLSPDGIYSRRRLSLYEDIQKEQKIGNMIARLHFPRISDPIHKIGVLSSLYIVKNLISYEYGKRLNDGSIKPLEYIKHLFNIITDPVDITKFLIHWITKRTFAARKFPSIILSNRNNLFSFDVHGEQEPNVNSRVSLIDATDPLGMPQIKVDWHYTKNDILTVKRTLDIFAAEFERKNIGTVYYDESKIEEELLRFGAYGGHHIGTARMGNDVKNSVVDANCKVHGVSNLFIAGSSVFPTSSQANPTLTIVAMSLRLADHLLTI
jgi:choline dehydrogenase-like flavoprotein